MKATRQTIPTLVEKRAEFTNDSGTLRAIRYPSQESIRRYIVTGDLDEYEAQTLQANAQSGIAYLVVSYQIPIAWETMTGAVHINSQTLTQTSRKHRELLDGFTAR